LTADGTPHTGLLWLVTAADLQPTFGDNPLAILHAIAEASSIEVLRPLHQRARAFLLSQLTEPSAVDWLAAFADRINISLARRLTELAGAAGGEWTWCFWGAAGRCELLVPVEPGIALICRDTGDVDRARQALLRLRADLGECGYLPHAAPDFAEEVLCAPVAAWQERLAEWVRNPIWTEMYRARPLFDLRPAWGDPEPWNRLEQSTREVIAAEPSFQQVLANDCLSELPPLTFFQDAVVDESGERSEVFAMQLRALGPIVEVGRVFGIANQRVLGSSTLERLELARSRMPAHESIFREAMETLRVLLYLQARSGLRLHDSGAGILPSQLSRLDRQALKSGFRAIHNLLEFTVNRLLRAAP
jgi:CBS domain-containing protein